MTNKENKGKVYLVGSGPGDVSLITLKAIECLKKADAVIYDYLANPELLNYCKSDVVKKYVGKRAGHHSVKQDNINSVLLDFSTKYKNIVRLKGGDPFVFGRGGEEVQTLSDNNIDFEIVPGITAGVAVPAYAGIPVTHRDCGPVLSFVTGHERKGKENSQVDWKGLANVKGTVVIYMGVTGLPNICQKFIENGRNPETPVALIRWGTYANQQTITGTLNNIAVIAKEKGFKPPALVVIGEVVKYRKDFSWFEKKSLFGKRILIPRTRVSNSEMKDKLVDLGAEVIELPVVSHEKVLMSDPEKFVSQIRNSKLILFNSPFVVEAFVENLLNGGADFRILANKTIAAFGKETIKKLKERGLTADITFDKNKDLFVNNMISALSDKNDTIISLEVENASQRTKEMLIGKEAKVNSVILSKQVIPVYEKDFLEDMFIKGFDNCIFGSSTTVKFFSKLMKHHNLDYILNNIEGISMGRCTSKTAINHAVNINSTTKSPTYESVVECIGS